MTNDQFHEKLDELAADVLADVRREFIPAPAKQVIRAALEKAIEYDHELHYERKFIPVEIEPGSVEVVKQERRPFLGD